MRQPSGSKWSRLTGSFALVVAIAAAGTGDAQVVGGGVSAGPAGLGASPASAGVATNPGIGGRFGGVTPMGGFNNRFGTVGMTYGSGVGGLSYGSGVGGLSYGSGVGGLSFSNTGFGGGFFGPGNFGTFGHPFAYGGGLMAPYGPGVSYPGGVYPFGGFGYGMGGFGATPFSQMGAMGGYGMGRYNVASGENVSAYQQGVLTHQKAIDQLLSNRIKATNPLFSKADYEQGATQLGMDPEMPAEPLPLDQVLTSEGSVLWPLAAPTESSRQEADRAIAKAIGVDRDPKDRPKLRDLINAREALADYAQTAYEQLKDDEEGRHAKGFEHFVMSLDYHLRRIGDRNQGMARSGGSGRPIPQPDDAPKTAGEVVKEQIQQDSSPGSGGQRPDPAKDAPPPPPSGDPKP